MNSRFKFRAWHREQKRMFDVYGLGKDFITEDTWNGFDYGQNAFAEDDLKFIEVMQFSCKVDTHGDNIFEGDIVKVTEYIGGNFIDYKYETYVVLWVDSGFVLKPTTNSQYTFSLSFSENQKV